MTAILERKEIEVKEAAAEYPLRLPEKVTIEGNPIIGRAVELLEHRHPGAAKLIFSNKENWVEDKLEMLYAIANISAIRRGLFKGDGSGSDDLFMDSGRGQRNATLLAKMMYRTVVLRERGYRSGSLKERMSQMIEDFGVSVDVAAVRRWYPKVRAVMRDWRCRFSVSDAIHYSIAAALMEAGSGERATAMGVAKLYTRCSAHSRRLNDLRIALVHGTIEKVL